MQEPKYLYIRNQKGLPVACLAYSKSGNTLTYGLSVHNPLDKFDRSLARKIAKGRLQKRPLALSLGGATDPSLKDLLRYFMTKLSQNDLLMLFECPQRLCDAADNYLVHSLARV